MYSSFATSIVVKVPEGSVYPSDGAFPKTGAAAFSETTQVVPPQRKAASEHLRKAGTAFLPSLVLNSTHTSQSPRMGPHTNHQHIYPLPLIREFLSFGEASRISQFKN